MLKFNLNNFKFINNLINLYFKNFRIQKNNKKGKSNDKRILIN